MPGTVPAAIDLEQPQEGTGAKLTRHSILHNWVDRMIDLCKPENVHWCTGTQSEYDALCQRMVDTGTFLRLRKDKRPNSFLCRSDPGDVARVEDRTYICSASPNDAGPTNNWRDPAAMKAELRPLFDGCMQGRTMFVIPYSMGPIGSPLSKIGIEVTDSAYVVVNMQIMARVGTEVLKALGNTGEFVRGLHSVGAPLREKSMPDVPWPCDPDRKYICHFPETREIWSYGSGYGGNALLGKKCHALRIASVQARDEGWMAEHMLILKLTNPEGQVRFMAAAFPSACGKTNLAMMNPTLPGWKVETIGDDIAWMRFDDEGNLRAINPEAGFFGVAPGTNFNSNPNAMKSCAANSIFTNCALDFEGDVWWEDMTDEKPVELIDWLRRDWNPQCGRPAAHPNARFTAPARQCPVIAPEWEDPAGVPISAILFGGRRASVVPLVMEAFSWQYGVFLGAIMASEKTAAAAGKVGVLRRDPMAMLPFCGYHMGDYFAHWLKMGQRPGARLPKTFYVNWFRKSATGRFLWPGFGDNCRVLKWIFGRCDEKAAALKTPIGYLPTRASLDVSGLDISADALDQLLGVDFEGWVHEIPLIQEHFASFGAKLPAELLAELDGLNRRLGGG